MKQLKLNFLLTILMSMVGATISAHDFAVANADGVKIYYVKKSNTEVAVSYCGSSYDSFSNEYTGNVVIPESVTYDGKTYSVTSIGTQAFYNCRNLTSVTIPSSVTSIGYGAFYNTAWYNNQPDGLVYAGKVAYKYKGTMPYYTSITIEDGTLGIAEDAFRSFTRLTSVTIPNSVTSIGDYAFDGCTSLTSITIPNSVTSIGDNAFGGCHGLKKVIVSDIAAWCGISFGNSSANPLYYGDHIYSNEDTEVTDLVIPNGVTCIGNYAFCGCSSMTSITIPNSLTSIGSGAFWYCTGLTSVTIPNSVTSIGDKAFYNTRLMSVVVGSGVLSIGDNAFGYEKLAGVPQGNRPTKIIWLTNTPPNGSYYAAGTVNYVANDSYTSFSNKKVYPFLSSMFEVDGVRYVPVSPSERTCDAIDCAYNESAENINIGKSVSYQGIDMTVKYVNEYVCYQNGFIKNVELAFEGNLGNNAFQKCTDITKVIVKNAGNIGVSAFSGITGEFTAIVNNEGSIDSQAFCNSTGLKTLDVGTNVTYIGSEAFKGCTLLETAKLQNKGAIGNNAFQNCTAMTTTTLGEKITSIGNYAFSGCSSLQSIVIPNAATSIGDYGFSDCSSMASVKIGSGVITIGTYAFNNCSALSQIVIPQSVTKIDNYAFYGCTSLANVNMEDRNSDDTALTLGSNGSNPLFSSCPLDEVYIGRNISYSTASDKGYSPFYRNTSLKTVTITNKETEISPNEFYGCTSLKNVTIGDGVTTIGDWAFSGCSSLDYFACGSKVANIGKEAFSDCTAMTKLISRAATPPVCGAQALDDINKWNCKLQVPEASIPAYQAADQWKDFFFIEPTGINEIKEDTTRQYRYYDLNGNLLLQPHKGVNILKSSNGKTKKVLVK